MSGGTNGASRIFFGDCFKELSDISKNGVFIWDIVNGSHFVLAYANTASETYLGMGETCVGRQPEQIFGVQDAALILGHLTACRADGRPVEYTHEIRNKVLIMRFYPSIEDGKTVRVMGTACDLTAYLTKSRQLEDKRTQLEQCQSMLKSQIGFEELIADVLRDFMDRGQSGFDACVKRLMRALCSIMETDYACAHRCDDALAGTDFVCARQPQWQLAGIAREAFAGAEHHLRAGRMLVLSDTIKGDKARITSLCGCDGVCALLMVPVQRGGDLWGALCLAQFGHGRCWTTAEITNLKIASETVMSVYLRLKMEKQLCESNRMLVEYDESLQELLAAEETIAKISRRFLKTDKAGFDGCVEAMLAEIADLFDADAASVYVNGQDGDASYQWSRRGFANWHKRSPEIAAALAVLGCVTGKQLLAIDNIQEHCPLPVTLRDSFLSLGIRAAICVPLSGGDDTQGVMLFCRLIGSAGWPRVQISAARVFADIFISAFEKNRWKKRLSDEVGERRRNDALQAAVLLGAVGHAQRFVDAVYDELPACFDALFRELAKGLGIHSACLYRYGQNGLKNRPVFDWHAKNRKNHKKSAQKQLSCIPVHYRKRVWGCLYVEYSGWNLGPYNATLQVFAQMCVRAYMRAGWQNSKVLSGADQAGQGSDLLLPRPVIV